MGFLAAAGAALQVGGAVAGNAASRAALEDQGNANSEYQESYRDWSGRSQEQEQALQKMLGVLADKRYTDYGTLAAALNGPGRTAAGKAAAGERDQRIGAAMDAVGARSPIDTHPDVGVSGTAANDWAQRAAEFYQPQVKARRALYDSQAGAAGEGQADRTALNDFQVSETNRNRQAGEAQRRTSLMTDWYNQRNQADSMRYGYTGPSNGFYNRQLISQAAGAVGGALVSAGAGSSGGKSSGGWA